MFSFVRLLQQQPNQRPSTSRIIETLKQMRQSTETKAVQQQLNDLTGELHRLKETIKTSESIDGVLKEHESQLQHKEEELRNKDETIAQLQRQIVEMAISSDEIRSKDEEINKLKELLRIKKSNDELNEIKK